MATLPPISDLGNINAPSGSGPSPALVQIHVDLQCAVMGLNRRIPEVDDRERYSNRLGASRTLANLASTIKDPSVIFAHVPLVVCFLYLCRVASQCITNDCILVSFPCSLR